MHKKRRYFEGKARNKCKRKSHPQLHFLPTHIPYSICGNDFITKRYLIKDEYGHNLSAPELLERYVLPLPILISPVALQRC